MGSGVATQRHIKKRQIVFIVIAIWPPQNFLVLFGYKKNKAARLAHHEKTYINENSYKGFYKKVSIPHKKNTIYQN